MKYSLQDILNAIPSNYTLQGTPSYPILINNLKPTNLANPSSLVFIAPHRDDKQMLAETTQARLIICDHTVKLTHNMAGKVLIQVDNPKLVLVVIGNKLFIKKYAPQIHPTAVIHPEANIHSTAYIGPHTYVGKAVIGAETQIHGNVHIYDNVTIGQRVVLKAGCVIGSHGHGYVRDKHQLFIKFPHVGTVTVEDDVEIGANVCIDVGSLGDTFIGYGTKIDNLVHIAHNVHIGKHVSITANTAIAGSTKIGDYTEIWMSASIADYIKVEDNTTIGIGSVVIKNVATKTSVFGNPARRFKKK